MQGRQTWGNRDKRTASARVMRNAERFCKLKKDEIFVSSVYQCPSWASVFYHSNAKLVSYLQKAKALSLKQVEHCASISCHSRSSYM